MPCSESYPVEFARGHEQASLHSSCALPPLLLVLLQLMDCGGAAGPPAPVLRLLASKACRGNDRRFTCCSAWGGRAVPRSLVPVPLSLVYGILRILFLSWIEHHPSQHHVRSSYGSPPMNIPTPRCHHVWRRAQAAGMPSAAAASQSGRPPISGQR